MTGFTPLTILPLSVTIVGAAFAIVIFNHYFSTRRRPHELAWGVAFILFALAGATQVIADRKGSWTEGMARVYYLTGAILNVAFLGLATAYLLWSRRAATVTLVLVVVLTAVSVFVLFTVPVDSTKLADEAGWKAVASISTAPRWLAAISNTL